MFVVIGLKIIATSSMIASRFPGSTYCGVSWSLKEDKLDVLELSFYATSLARSTQN
jgi:hypothetical protein